MTQLFTNGASALLQASLGSGDVSLTLAPGEGARFPAPTNENYAILTLEDTNGNYEIVKLTERSGDILTIERGFENTTPRGFSAGDRIELRITAAGLGAFKQKAEQWRLRGDTIDSDGQRFWHVSDPSAYQYFLCTYTTLDITGQPALRWQPPAGMTELSYVWGLTGPDGTNRVMQYTGALTGTAPAPCQNEVALDVPGVVRFTSIDYSFAASPAYISWDSYMEGTDLVSLMRFDMDNAGAGAVGYLFYTRDKNGDRHLVQFYGDGDIGFERNLRIRQSRLADFPTADDFGIAHVPDPTDPEAGDWAFFRRVNRATVARKFEYVFTTRDVEDPPVPEDPPVITERSVRFKPDGNVRLSAAVTPVNPQDLTTKAYVDSRGGAGGSGYGRAQLWSGYATSASPNQMLSASIYNYHQVVVVALINGMAASVTLDTVTVDAFDGVSGRIWVIGYDTAGTGENLGIRFIDGTTFEVMETGVTGVVERVIGVFPKG